MVITTDAIAKVGRAAIDSTLPAAPNAAIASEPNRATKDVMIINDIDMLAVDKDAGIPILKIFRIILLSYLNPCIIGVIVDFLEMKWNIR